MKLYNNYGNALLIGHASHTIYLISPKSGTGDKADFTATLLWLMKIWKITPEQKILKLI